MVLNGLALSNSWKFTWEKVEFPVKFVGLIRCFIEILSSGIILWTTCSRLKFKYLLQDNFIFIFLTFQIKWIFNQQKTYKGILFS